MSQWPPSNSGDPGEGPPGWSEQQPQPQQPPAFQPGQPAGEPDPWVAAQYSEFVYRPGTAGAPGAAPPGTAGAPGTAQQGPREAWGAPPGYRPDNDPYAAQKTAPMHKPIPDEVKTGTRLAIGCGAVAFVVAVIAIGAVILFYRSTAKSGIQAVEAGMAAQARVMLEQAVQDQRTYFAQYERFTDDPEVLRRAGSQLQYVTGVEVENRQQVAVLICHSGAGVLIQKKANESTYFAAYLGQIDAVPFWARDRQDCPEEFDEEGNPGPPWSTTGDVFGTNAPPASMPPPATTGEPRIRTTPPDPRPTDFETDPYATPGTGGYGDPGY